MRKWVLFVFGLSVIPPQFTSVRASELQQSYMVWDKTCIKEVIVKASTFIDAPLVDGKPDLKQAIVHNLNVIYDSTCGRIEIRRVK